MATKKLCPRADNRPAGVVVSNDDRKNTNPKPLHSAGILATHHRRLARRTSQPHLRTNPLEGNIVTAGVVTVCRVGHIKDFHDLTVIQLHL